MVVGDQIDLNKIRIVVGAGLHRAGGWRVHISRALIGPHRPDPLDLARDQRGWRFVALASWGMPIPTIACAILDTVDPGHSGVAAYLRKNSAVEDHAWLDRCSGSAFGRAMDQYEVHITKGIPSLAWSANARPIKISATTFSKSDERTLPECETILSN